VPPPPLCTQAGDPDHYACIGVTHDATADELRRAYRKVSLASHPDKPGGSEEAFSRVSAAYKVLHAEGQPEAPPVNLAPRP
jgi:curved DNA-binding protein CbpA